MSPIISVKRLIALVVIFIATTAAWFILAGVVMHRTNDLDTRLRSKVAAMWGSTQAQRAPSFMINTGKLVTIPARQGVPAWTHFEIVEAETHSNIAVALAYEPRQKGLLWYNLYTVDFDGSYAVVNTADHAVDVVVGYTFPDERAIYDGFAVLLDGEELTLTENGAQRSGTFSVPSGATRTVKVRYHSQGQDAWRYTFNQAEGVSTVRNFRLTATTNFTDVDFAEQSLAPEEKTATDDGWRMTWAYDRLVGGQDIGILVPQRINPGPFVQRVTLFAPIALAFFFFVLLMVVVLRKIPLHPMHFAFLAAAFFSFHLLFAYLVDHLAIGIAFAIAAVVSVALTVSYLRLVAGVRFAFVHAGIAQLIYLVAFTYSFFFEGYTGLIITILAILTLAVMMQITGRVPWAQLFTPENRTTPS